MEYSVSIPFIRHFLPFKLLMLAEGFKISFSLEDTTDVCVHTTMRDANDRGYECLLLSDCTGATDYGNYLAALKMVTMQGGVLGAVTDSEAVIKAINLI